MSAAGPLPKPLLIVAAGRTFEALAQREGDFSDWIAQGLGPGLPQRRLYAPDVVDYPEPQDLAGVVVSGSHSMVTDRAAWSERLAAWLKRCVLAEVPVLGICFGHQLLAHALGAEVGKLPGGPEIGTQRLRLTPEAQHDELLGALPPEFAAQLVHYQSVLRLPPDAVPLAHSEREPHEAFRMGRRAWGLQFHPEFSASAMRGYVEHVKQDLPDAQASLNAVCAAPEAAGLLRRFAALAAAG